jgi:hypothetical protein
MICKNCKHLLKQEKTSALVKSITILKCLVTGEFLGKLGIKIVKCNKHCER